MVYHGHIRNYRSDTLNNCLIHRDAHLIQNLSFGYETMALDTAMYNQDFLKDMNAVLKDLDCDWLNGLPPDYSLSNELYLKGKCFK